MQNFQAIKSSTEAEYYYKKSKKVERIENQIDLYGSIPILLIIVSLIVYFLKIDRKQRFEFTILITMILKYALCVLYQVFTEQVYQITWVYIVF